MTKIRYEAEAREIKTAREFKWQPIPLGMHEGKTWPEVLIVDPGYVFWGIGKDFRGPLLHQLKIVAARAKHILPPRENPDEYQFGIKFKRKGGLDRILILEATDSPDGFLVMPHLDLSIVRLFAQSDWPSKNALAAWFRKEFFGEGWVSREACEAFLYDDSNFDLTCREVHGVPARAS